VSQFLETPRVPYRDVVTRIVHYLNQALSLHILYKRNQQIKVEGFNDVDRAGSPSDRRSATWYCTF
jgi:hypothetical protein